MLQEPMRAQLLLRLLTTLASIFAPEELEVAYIVLIWRTLVVGCALTLDNIQRRLGNTIRVNVGADRNITLKENLRSIHNVSKHHPLSHLSPYRMEAARTYPLVKLSR